MNNNYNSNTVVDGRAAHMTDTTRQSAPEYPPPPYQIMLDPSLSYSGTMSFYSLPNHLKDIQNNWLIKFQKSINTKQQKLRELLEKQLWCQIDSICRIMMSNEVIVVNSLHNFRPITRVGVFIH